jgi:hypothetical protein
MNHLPTSKLVFLRFTLILSPFSASTRTFKIHSHFTLLSSYRRILRRSCLRWRALWRTTSIGCPQLLIRTLLPYLVSIFSIRSMKKAPSHSHVWPIWGPISYVQPLSVEFQLCIKLRDWIRKRKWCPAAWRRLNELTSITQASRKMSRIYNAFSRNCAQPLPKTRY